MHLSLVPAAEPSPLTATRGELPRLDPAARLLIVDDIADNRIILARRFVRQGFIITEAESGEQALALIENGEFDCVLLDVMMPGLNGIEVLQRIRTRLSPVDLPVIMCTAKTQSQDLVLAFREAANDYVTKPVDFAVALARVNVQLARKRAEEEVRRVSEALRRSNEMLEERVVERTAELSTINDQLKGEISQREESEARSRFLAYHDALTGLPNRLGFRHEIETVIAGLGSTTAEWALLFVDLDGFKMVNDTLGHSIGDMLLKVVGNDLRALLDEDDRIARLGGDEFAILKRCGQRSSAAVDLARAVIAAAKRTRVIEGHEILIGASVGVVSRIGVGDEPEALLKNADLAMYRAKGEGRGTYRVFSPDMDALAQARRQLEIDLRSAFQHAQFELFYQPIIAMSSRRISGFEALLRWRHPERGMVSPADFIPVAEDMGLIVPLGDWVLREACKQAATWPAPLRIAVNVSTVQFLRGNIVASVLGALATSGLAPSRLEVEITESVLLEKTDNNIAMLNQLRELGVRISMDDFGTGYSSLGYLRRFQFDKIKIDQSFVRDLTNSRESDAIVHVITGLGSRFGISTTAEGVETTEQMHQLHLEGCTEVQGRFYSMPVPAIEAERLIRAIGVASKEER